MGVLGLLGVVFVTLKLTGVLVGVGVLLVKLCNFK